MDSNCTTTKFSYYRDCFRRL